MDALISPRRRQVMLAAAGSVALAACQRGGAGGLRVHVTGETMGSTYNVKADASSVGAERLADSVRAALQSVDERMSLFRPESELSALNAAAAGVPFRLSAELFTVLASAQQVSRWSDGAFDVTVAPAVEAWGFGIQKHRRIPTTQSLAAQRAAVDWKSLQLDAGQRTAIKARRETRVDLNGIAKGYGVDAAAAALDALGVAHYMIEVGGEVRTRGLNASGEPWQIGIEEPDAKPQRARHIVPLTGRALATSGDYRIYYEDNGRRYSHEIDPMTAAPIAHGLCSVSAVADDCMRADAIATALIVVGLERGFALAESSGIAAHFIERTARGRYRDRMTSAFAALAPRQAA